MISTVSIYNTSDVVDRSSDRQARVRRHGGGERGRGGGERHGAGRSRGSRQDGGGGQDEGGGGRGRERREPPRAVVGARQHRPAPPRRIGRRRPRPAPRRPLRLPRRGTRRGLRPDHGAGQHEEDAGGKLQEGRVPRAGHLRTETGERHGGGRGGRPEGDHLPGRGGHARGPPRPGQPRPGHDQEGVAGQRERLPRPPRELPRSGREAAESAWQQLTSETLL